MQVVEQAGVPGQAAQVTLQHLGEARFDDDDDGVAVHVMTFRGWAGVWVWGWLLRGGGGCGGLMVAPGRASSCLLSRSATVSLRRTRCGLPSMTRTSAG